MLVKDKENISVYCKVKHMDSSFCLSSVVRDEDLHRLQRRVRARASGERYHNSWTEVRIRFVRFI